MVSLFSSNTYCTTFAQKFNMFEEFVRENFNVMIAQTAFWIIQIQSRCHRKGKPNIFM